MRAAALLVSTILILWAKGVGTVPMTVTFGDYRPVAGVMQPFRVESTSALTGTQVTQYTDVKAQ